jgi:hypothetical protein
MRILQLTPGTPRHPHTSLLARCRPRDVRLEFLSCILVRHKGRLAIHTSIQDIKLSLDLLAHASGNITPGFQIML